MTKWRHKHTRETRVQSTHPLPFQDWDPYDGEPDNDLPFTPALVELGMALADSVSSPPWDDTPSFGGGGGDFGGGGSSGDW